MCQNLIIFRDYTQILNNKDEIIEVLPTCIENNVFVYQLAKYIRIRPIN